MRFLFLILFCFFTVEANAYCTEPIKPICLSTYHAFDDKYEYDSCKKTVEIYFQQLKYYAECITKDIELKKIEAINNFNTRVNSKYKK